MRVKANSRGLASVAKHEAVREEGRAEQQQQQQRVCICERASSKRWEGKQQANRGLRNDQLAVRHCHAHRPHSTAAEGSISKPAECESQKDTSSVFECRQAACSGKGRSVS